MDPIIRTSSKASRMSGRLWHATCTERLFCLFKCEFCGRINAVRLPVSFTAMEQFSERDAVAEINRMRPAVLNELKVPGPNQASLLRETGCKCTCNYCQRPPAWAAEIQKCEKRINRVLKISLTASVIGILMLILPGFIILMGFDDIMVSERTVLCYGGFAFLMMAAYLPMRFLYPIHKGKQIDRKIKDAIRDRPPLLGDSMEEVARLAKDCAAYAGDDVRADMEWTDLTGGKHWRVKVLYNAHERRDEDE